MRVDFESWDVHLVSSVRSKSFHKHPGNQPPKRMADTPQTEVFLLHLLLSCALDQVQLARQGNLGMFGFSPRYGTVLSAIRFISSRCILSVPFG